MKVRLIIALIAALLGLEVGVGAPSADAAKRPVVHRMVERPATVVFAGRASKRAVVRIQLRKPRGWKTVRKVRANRKGAFRAVIKRPRRTVLYRAVSKRRASVIYRVSPRPRPRVEPTSPVTAEPTPVEVPVSEEPVAEQPGAEDPVATPAPTDACGVRPQKRDGSYWECTFSDDFDGTQLDRSKWLVQGTHYSGMTSGNHDCYVDDASTVKVSDGTIKLTATRNLEPFVCRSPFGDFVTTSKASATVTRGLFTQTYGLFEFRAKMPKRATGPHSALWLYPQDHTYGKWPYSGEIDVAEWFGSRPDNVYPSVHYSGENNWLSTGFECAMPTASTEFHTYAVEWTPTIMRFYYDGKECFSHKWTPDNGVAPKPFDHPYYMVLTQVWGHDWNAPDSSTGDSSTLEVDWARAWK